MKKGIMYFQIAVNLFICKACVRFLAYICSKAYIRVRLYSCLLLLCLALLMGHFLPPYEVNESILSILKVFQLAISVF